MNFIKNVSKSVGDGVNILTLDGIVEDILENHEKELKAFVASREEFVSAEEAETIEAGWFATRNESYDRRAQKALGKNMPENWTESKDLLCVRKRILNRGLEKVKGQLLIRMAEKNESSKTLYLDVLRAANAKLSEQRELISARFPLGPDELNRSIDLQIRNIKNEAKAAAPNIDDLASRFSDVSVTDSNQSWSALQAKIESTAVQLQSQNTLAINGVIESLRKTTVENLKRDMALSFQQEQDRFLDSLKAKGVLSDAQAVLLQADLSKQLETRRTTMKKSLDEITLSI